MNKIHGNSKYHNILTKKFLYKEYVVKKKSTTQIAKEVEYDRTVVWDYVKKNGIKTRSTSEHLKGKKNPEHSKRMKAKMKGKHSWNYKGGKPKCVDCGKEIWYGFKRCKHCAGVYKWKDKEHRENQLKAIFKGMQLSPNQPEKLLIKLLKKLLPKEYKFVGDGKLIVDGFNPDFINCNGQKKIIEFYGDYWHNKPKSKKRDKRRKIAYKKLGYKTLIIWEKELKNLNKVTNKIKQFNNAKI